MEINIPTWVIAVLVIIIALYLCGCGKKLNAETFLSPFGLAPRQADMVEIAMRGKMFEH